MEGDACGKQTLCRAGHRNGSLLAVGTDASHKLARKCLFVGVEEALGFALVARVGGVDLARALCREGQAVAGGGAITASGGLFDEPIGSACGMPQGGFA